MKIRKDIPGFIYPLIFIAGPLPLWPFAFRLSPSLRVFTFAAPLLTLGLPFLLSWNWLMLAPFLAGLNGVFALSFLLLHPPQSGDFTGAPRSAGDGFTERLRGGVGLAMAGIPFGLILVSLEQWITDALWSGYYPVNASLDSIPHEVGAAWMLFTLVFFIAALYLSPELRPVTPLRILALLIATFAVYLAVHQFYLVLVAIPEWQTEVRAIFPPWVMGIRETLFHLLIYAGVPLALGSLFHAASNGRAWPDFTARLASVLLSLVMAAWVSGMPIHYALLLGQQAEKSGRPTQAIPWYSRALTWSQSEKLKSYLQFRVGLLYRKTGRLEEARDAFTRVLVRYPRDETLLDDADEFKEKLATGRATQGRRVVIPGIEARTEYKSAYCVPNSLGLLLNFWGDHAGAKRIGSEITQLDRGSLLTDEVYYAESRGFASLVLPLCSLDEMHRLIDAGIPVLAFIPGHVIAVFGYDEALGTLVTYDVGTFDIWDDARSSRFAADWSLTYNTLGVVTPRELLPKVRAILGSGVEARSEAYLNYLLASLIESDPELRVRYLRRAQGQGIFPAGWEYRATAGDTAVVAGEDSVARAFLLTHETDEQSPYVFALDQLWRGRNWQAFDFLKKVGERKPLSPPLLEALAAAELSAGKPAEAAGILARSASSENMEPAPAAFLLRRANEENEVGDWAGRLSVELLDRNELHGDEARLAYRTWRTTGLREDGLDDALREIHSYLDRWHPYDTLAIRDLRETLARKSFRPNEEADQRVWKKQMRLLEIRRARLEWAAGG